MQSTSMRKITISLPENLVDFADRMARQGDTSRSRVISRALAEAQARAEQQLAEEGYRFYAGESIESAQATAQAVAESTMSVTAGEDGNDGEAW